MRPDTIFGAWDEVSSVLLPRITPPAYAFFSHGFVSAVALRRPTRLVSPPSLIRRLGDGGGGKPRPRSRGISTPSALASLSPICHADYQATADSSESSVEHVDFLQGRFLVSQAHVDQGPPGRPRESQTLSRARTWTGPRLGPVRLREAAVWVREGVSGPRDTEYRDSTQGVASSVGTAAVMCWTAAVPRPDARCTLLRGLAPARTKSPRVPRSPM